MAGDPDAGAERAFFEALGRAIAKWQELELILAILFATLIDPQRIRLGRLLFNGLQGFRDKLKLTDTAACEVLFNSPLLDEWKVLHKALSTLADRRNHLAHGVTSIDPATGQQFLRNAPLSSRKFDPARTLGHAEVVRCESDFEEAANQVADFIGHLKS